jgi:hypothetical protein
VKGKSDPGFRTKLAIGADLAVRDLHAPAVLAGAGTMGIVVLGVIAVGRCCSRFCSVSSSGRLPVSDGGLYGTAAIGSLRDVDAILTGKVGTIVTPSGT